MKKKKVKITIRGKTCEAKNPYITAWTDQGVFGAFVCYSKTLGILQLLPLTKALPCPGLGWSSIPDLSKLKLPSIHQAIKRKLQLINLGDLPLTEIKSYNP